MPCPSPHLVNPGLAAASPYKTKLSAVLETYFLRKSLHPDSKSIIFKISKTVAGPPEFDHRSEFLKRSIFSFLLIFFFSSILLAQQVQTQKIPYVAKEPSIFHSAVVSALNIQTGQSLVVWEKISGPTHSIMGRVINYKGKPVSGQILLADPPAARPAIVYNPVRNEYLLAYDDNPDLRQAHSDVFLRRLNAQGRPAAAAAKATSDSISTAMANFRPRLSCNSRNGTYGIVWLREVLTSGQLAEGNNGLVGTVLTGANPVPGGVAVISRTVIEGAQFLWPTPLDIVYHPTNGKVIVGYIQIASGTNGSRANYTLATLEGNFGNIAPSNFGLINANAIELSNQFFVDLRLAFQANGNGLVFFVDSSNLKKRKINNLGKLSGPASVAFRPPKNNSKLFFPSVAFSNGPSGIRGLLIAVEGPFSETGAAVIWAQFLNETGIALGVPIKLDTTISTETVRATALVGIPQPPNSATYRFAGFYVQAAFIAPGQTFQNSGILELNLNATLP